MPLQTGPELPEDQGAWEPATQDGAHARAVCLSIETVNQTQIDLLADLSAQAGTGVPIVKSAGKPAGAGQISVKGITHIDRARP